MITAIGRAIGRAAAHEFAHQFLGSTDIDSNQDASRYEYRSADRVEQDYGEMRWGTAASLIAERIGVSLIRSFFKLLKKDSATALAATVLAG